MANNWLCCRTSTLMLGSALSLSMATAAMAQDVQDDDEDLEEEPIIEEMIVTVERRTQSLQSLAGTAAVISGDRLKALGIRNVQGLDGKIPGLSINNNQGNIEVFIRGIGSTNNTELGDPAAATHFNGVYIPRPRGFGTANLDIERVEVNTGPQGTLRGRNATAGSVNLIPWGPGLGQWDVSAEFGYGNFNQVSSEVVINAPVTENSAIRVAGLFLRNESLMTNVNPDSSELGANVPTSEAEGIGVSEQTENYGVRGAYRIEFLENFDFTLTADYASAQGSDTTGVNFANPLGNGILPEEIDDPRRVLGRAFTPTQDTEHWGIQGKLLYDGNGFNVEYLGSYRDLDFDFEFVTPLSPFYDGVFDNVGPDDFDDFSRVRFVTASESQIQELRFFSDDDARFLWSGGFFYFNEQQRTFLGTTGDRNPFFSGVEFNQDTSTLSYSFYGDATYEITDRFRLTGGVRFTRDRKERFGVNAQYQFITGGAGFAPIGIGQGTEGFQFAALDRTLLNPNTDTTPDADGEQFLSDQEVLAFFFDGVANFGARDGFDDIFGDLQTIPGDAPAEGRPVCANFAISGSCPQDGVEPFFDEGLDGLISFAVLGNNSIALQNGRFTNSFVDWRTRLEYDITDRNLVYFLVATGNRSGGFNDNIPGTEGLGVANPSQSAPALFDADTLAPTYGPEQLRLFELGFKNEFDFDHFSMRFNASGFYYDYNDLQLTSLVSVAQILDFEGVPISDDIVESGLGSQVVSFTFNASDARIAGAQFEGGFELPYNVNFDFTVLWLPEANVVNSQEIQDFRYQADVDVDLINNETLEPIPDGTLDNAINRSIDGNRLIRSPKVSVSGTLTKAWDLSFGQFDVLFSFNYRSSQFMTIFNNIDFNPTDDQDLRLLETVPSYWTIDMGGGFNIGRSDKPWRIEAYASNLTDVQQPQGIIVTQFDNTRFFNTPRLYGFRIRKRF